MPDRGRADSTTHDPALALEPASGPPRVDTAEQTPRTSAVVPDIYLGSTQPSPQYGILGECSGKRVAIDLNETHTISLFGVQGGGKSYTLGSIIEAASLADSAVNLLPRPLATIVFHYSPTLDYAPEFTSMTRPNADHEQTRLLRERYGAEPAGLDQMLMLVPEDQLAQRREEYPGTEVLPLKFGSAELRASHWRFLMGAVGNQSTYIRQLSRIMKANRNNLSLDTIRDGVDGSQLPDAIKQLAHQRLDLAADYIDDTVRIKDLISPGRVIIVDLRDELIEKDEALGLFVVLMELFAEATTDGERFNKLVVFDEAHKYIESPDLVSGLVESVREMRHKGMSILVASQDPPSVPIPLIELSNHVILHKFNSPAWLKHLQKANAALADLTPTKMASLAPGEAYVWSSKATDLAFTRGAVKVRLRPRVTRHGGGTRTAVGDDD
jgi:DNA helicase HerA-like ATPase